MVGFTWLMEKQVRLQNQVIEMRLFEKNSAGVETLVWGSDRLPGMPAEFKECNEEKGYPL